VKEMKGIVHRRRREIEIQSRSRRDMGKSPFQRFFCESSGWDELSGSYYEWFSDVLMKLLFLQVFKAFILV
jgi:hypothetical protein